LSIGLATALGLLAFVAWQALSLSPPSVTASTTIIESTAAAATPFSTDMPELARQTQYWLAVTAPGTHVIQVAATKDAAQAAVLLEALDAATPKPVRVLHGLSRGSPTWMILAGEFPDRESALAALRTLPAPHDSDPFLRTAGKMRTVVLPTGP
jgi:septal ring-binding cell division protein DamX